MSTEVALVETANVSLGTLQATKPRELVAGATEIANQLANVIKSRNLSVRIGNKNYVRVEGWTTLTALLGVMPREVSSEQTEDGSYISTIELVRMNDNQVICRASAECGMDEDRWSKMPRYARRSMAATRATGKAARLAFGWVMSLSGYESTPAEEMDFRFVDSHPAPAPESHAAPTPDLEGESGIWEGRLIEIKEASGTSKSGKPWTKWAMKCPDSPLFSTFSETIAKAAEEMMDEQVIIQWEKSGKFYNLMGIELAPRGFDEE